MNTAVVCCERSVPGKAALRKCTSGSLLHILYLGNFSSLFFLFLFRRYCVIVLMFQGIIIKNSEKEPGKIFLLFTFLFFLLESTEAVFSCSSSTFFSQERKCLYLDFHIASALCVSCGNTDNTFVFMKNCPGTQLLGH